MIKEDPHFGYNKVEIISAETERWCDSSLVDADFVQDGDVDLPLPDHLQIEDEVEEEKI